MKRSFQVPRKRPAAEVEGANGCYSKPASKPKIAPAAQVPPAQGRMPLTSVQTAAGWSAPSEPVIDKTEQGFQALYTASSQKRRNNKTWLGAYFRDVSLVTAIVAYMFLQPVIGGAITRTVI